MLYGYMGKMLFVNLTDGSIKEKELTEDLARNFLGGYGIGAKILYEMMPAGADPLGPDSVLGFVTHPANGTKAFFGARYTVVHKSPVYGGWNDANAGGFFGPQLKKAGYDAVFISGISEKPVYISIIEGKVEIKDASHLWGKDTKGTWRALQNETGNPKVRVACIGPAGEKLSYVSCVINDGHRAAARGGAGAVMGSKKLKAIVAYGTKEVPVAEPEKIMSVNKLISEAMKTSPFAVSRKVTGTAGSTYSAALSGDSPVKNWGGVNMTDFGDRALKLTAPEMDPKYKVKSYHCMNCPLGCGAEYEVKDGRWPLPQTERPEYETLAGFGTNALCDEADAVLKCNEICNVCGMDTLAVSGTLAWAMECYDNGILTKEELDGIELTWGNGAGMVALTEKMANAEGCGAVLANGSAYAARKWGKGFEYLVTGSGIELAMHDTRSVPGRVRAYAYDPTPGRHTRGGIGYAGGVVNKYDYRATGYLDVKKAAEFDVLSTGGFCLFIAFCVQAEVWSQYLSAITGIPFAEKHMLFTGLRIYLMRQAFNLREGFDLKKMTLSERVQGIPPLPAGPNGGVTIDTARILRNFDAWLGVDETGKPKLEVLQKLGGMEQVIKDLYGNI